jgi:hypothetical protein
MTIFEFLTVAVSLIMALGLSKLVSSVPFVFDRKKRDWLHIVLFILVIWAHLTVWWRIWLLNDVPEWNILQFVILMGAPLSLYLAATALLSPDPSRVDDWKQYLSEQSFWVFLAMAAVIIFGLLRYLFISNITPSLTAFLFLAIVVFGSFTKRRDVHIGIVLFGCLYSLYILTGNFVAS